MTHFLSCTPTHGAEGVWEDHLPHLSGWPAERPPPLGIAAAPPPQPRPSCSRSPRPQPSWFPFLPGHLLAQPEAARAPRTQPQLLLHPGAGCPALWRTGISLFSHHSQIPKVSNPQVLQLSTIAKVPTPLPNPTLLTWPRPFPRLLLT